MSPHHAVLSRNLLACFITNNLCLSFVSQSMDAATPSSYERNSVTLTVPVDTTKYKAYSQNLQVIINTLNSPVTMQWISVTKFWLP